MSEVETEVKAEKEYAILNENQITILFELYKYACASDRAEKYIVIKSYKRMAELIGYTSTQVNKIIDWLAVNDYIDIIYDRGGLIRNIKLRQPIFYRRALEQTYKKYLSLAEKCINMTNPSSFDLMQLPDWYFKETTFHKELK